MKFNTSLLVFAFAVTLLLSLVSAGATITHNAPASVAHNAGSFAFSVTVNNTEDAQDTFSFAGSTVSPGSISLSNVTVQGNSTGTATATITFPAYQTGTITGTIHLSNSTNSNINTVPFTVSINSSKDLSISKIKEITYSQNGTINISNNGNTLLSNVQLFASGAFPVTFSSTSLSLSAGNSQAVNVQADLSNLKFGSNTVSVTANDSSTGATSSTSFSVTKGFCRNGNVGGNLSISNVDISSTGDDNDIWKPLEVITVEVEVENNGDRSVSDVWAEIGLFNSEGTNVISKVDFESTDEETSSIGSLGEDDSDVVTFEFTLPADFNTGDYKLAVKTYSKKTGESAECDDSADDLDSTTYQLISVEKQDDEGKYIAFDKIKLTPSEATCGDTVALSFETINVGDVDQDRVKVKVYNKELKVDTYSEIKNSFDQGDKKSMSFTFTVPAGIADKVYNLELSSEYDYRSDNYRKQSGDVVKVPVKVIGCTPVTTRLASLSAALDSDAAAGKELVVKATIRNLGTDTNTFAVDATGYSSWATLSSVSGNILTLAPGDARDVIFKLNVNSDASGSKSFTINAASGNSVESKEVAVNLASTSGFNWNFTQGNGLLWTIGIVNVILIVIIIIVAVRVSRR